MDGPSHGSLVFYVTNGCAEPDARTVLRGQGRCGSPDRHGTRAEDRAELTVPRDISAEQNATLLTSSSTLPRARSRRRRVTLDPPVRFLPDG